ncbi:glycoside hydrolase family 13 protein [Actinomyces vulturis]|uniref:glycoside hydrolase family 13 protein n=1 Tax=Actinomyces vulturis TaxID=1857645 RepID=UPI00082BC481|nr:glycoside hydrolase family 13 protein [Actinomyces vulturis]
MTVTQPPLSHPDAWWRDAVFYQIYPRSFADANGDGMGDLSGIIDKVPYLESLGIDAVWLSPFYPSPGVDAGYDVANYFDIAPEFGTLDQADQLIAALHQAGIKVVIDLVPNHTSSEHEWFRQALEAGPGSPERERYHFRYSDDGMPNNWGSLFGGSAWASVHELTGKEEDRHWYYLHLFAPEQPDVNWDHPDVHEHFEQFLRFWCVRGIDGFRVDVAHALVKAPGLPDDDVGPDRWQVLDPDEEVEKQPDSGPAFNQPGVHEIYRHWRAVLNDYGEDKLLVAEAWVEPASELANYVRSDEMSQAFNFPFLKAGWDAQAMRHVIDETMEANAAVGAPTTWVLSNHDVVRHATRFGYPCGTDIERGIGPDDPQPDEELGLRRARAATLFMLALPGSVYLYQGEELGLPEHTTVPPEARQDPSWFRTDGVVRGRDGCRIPLPWSAQGPAYGFNETGQSWLPQPADWGRFAPEQQDDSASTLLMYRAALALRARLSLGRGELQWVEAPDGVLAFDNGEHRIILNVTDEEQSIPATGSVIMTSWAGVVSDQDADPCRWDTDTVTVPANGCVWIEK